MVASNASTANQMVNHLTNHLVKCVQPALSHKQLVKAEYQLGTINYTPMTQLSYVQSIIIWTLLRQVHECCTVFWWNTLIHENQLTNCVFFSSTSLKYSCLSSVNSFSL